MTRKRKNPMTNNSKSRGEDQLQSLLDAVERLRRDKYPALDANLVSELLRMHANSGAGDAEIARGVEQTVERYLTDKA